MILCKNNNKCLDVFMEQGFDKGQGFNNVSSGIVSNTIKHNSVSHKNWPLLEIFYFNVKHQERLLNHVLLIKSNLIILGYIILILEVKIYILKTRLSF